MGWEQRLQWEVSKQQIHSQHSVAVLSGGLFSIPMFSLELGKVHVEIKAVFAKS